MTVTDHKTGIFIAKYWPLTLLWFRSSYILPIPFISCLMTLEEKKVVWCLSSPALHHRPSVTAFTSPSPPPPLPPAHRTSLQPQPEPNTAYKVQTVLFDAIFNLRCHFKIYIIILIHVQSLYSWPCNFNKI